MRNLLFGIFALGLAACSSPSPSPNSYVIKGTPSEHLDGKSVYLRKLMPNGQYESIDTVVVANGAYQFDGETEKTFLAQVTTLDNSASPCAVLVQPGDITVMLDPAGSYAKGTALNDSLAALYQASLKEKLAMKALSEKFNQLKSDNELTPELEKELYAQADLLSQERKALQQDFVTNNAQNLAGLYILSSNMHAFTYEQVKEVVDQFPVEGHSSALYQRVKEREIALSRREPGAMFTDVTINNMQGEPIKLSQYIGKGNYVLLDFWASWCAPCRKEMPFVVATYKKYHSKGLEIVGISLDQKKSDWESAVKQMGMSWPQLSDLQGWKAEAARVYGINSIPATILFDPSGKVVATNLRGEELEQTIQSFLK